MGDMTVHFFVRAQAFGAVFNQLARSCAQLLFLEYLFVPSERVKTTVIEITTVKWKEGGLIERARTFSRKTAA